MGSHMQWTDETWNPTTGCTKISPGCAHCYIETTPPFRMAGRKFVKGHIPLLLHADRLDKPLHWKKPRRVFVNSLSDLFHEDVPDEFIDRVFAVMALCPQHTFQVLTKRAERMAGYCARSHRRTQESAAEAGWISKGDGFRCAAWPWPLPNVWLGVSCEDQQRADERIPWLLKAPAAVRFISAEPLLGPIDFRRAWRHDGCGYDAGGLELYCSGCGEPGKIADWVIVGGESGRGARPCNVAWIRSIIDQCKAAGVACFVKQLGSKPRSASTVNVDVSDYLIGGGESVPLPVRLADRKGGDPDEWPESLRVRQFPEVARA
jgi:protein gp37